jgi:hypothetical protein
MKQVNTRIILTILNTFVFTAYSLVGAEFISVKIIKTTILLYRNLQFKVFYLIWFLPPKKKVYFTGISQKFKFSHNGYRDTKISKNAGLHYTQQKWKFIFA